MNVVELVPAEERLAIVGRDTLVLIALSKCESIE